MLFLKAVKNERKNMTSGFKILCKDVKRTYSINHEVLKIKSFCGETGSN